MLQRLLRLGGADPLGLSRRSDARFGSKAKGDCAVAPRTLRAVLTQLPLSLLPHFVNT